MRRTTLGAIAFFAMLGISMITGCLKTNNPNNGLESTTAASINGNPFFAENESASYSPTTGLISVSASTSDVNAITFLVVIPQAAGLGVACPFDSGSVINYSLSTGGSYYGDAAHGHGSVTLTSWDKVAHYLSGTFSGTLTGSGPTDTVVVTNGKFNLYTYALLP